MDITQILIAILGDSTVANIVVTIAAVVGLTNVITVWLPNVAQNKFFQTVLDVLNWLSLNVGKNKNSK